MPWRPLGKAGNFGNLTVLDLVPDTLKRKLKPSLASYVVLGEGSGGYAVSAYPSVVIDVPAYIEKRPAFDADGNLIGVEDVSIDTHEEILRSPASWEAVNAIIAYYESRATTTPSMPV